MLGIDMKSVNEPALSLRMIAKAGLTAALLLSLTVRMAT
jgi:hypothetical protein